MDRLPADRDRPTLFIDYLQAIRDSDSTRCSARPRTSRTSSVRSADHAGYVLSGLPFSTLPEGVGPAIAAATYRVVRPGASDLRFRPPRASSRPLRAGDAGSLAQRHRACSPGLESPAADYAIFANQLRGVPRQPAVDSLHRDEHLSCCARAAASKGHDCLPADAPPRSQQQESIGSQKRRS